MKINGIEILILYLISLNYKYREIAYELGVTEGCIKGTIFRIKKKTLKE